MDTTEANSAVENDDASDSSLQEVEGTRRRRATKLPPVQSSRKKKKTTQEAIADSILQLASAISTDGKDSDNITPLERALKVFQKEFGDIILF